MSVYPVWCFMLLEFGWRLMGLLQVYPHLHPVYFRCNFFFSKDFFWSCSMRKCSPDHDLWTWGRLSELLWTGFFKFTLDLDNVWCFCTFSHLPFHKCLHVSFKLLKFLYIRRSKWSVISWTVLGVDVAQKLQLCEMCSVFCLLPDSPDVFCVVCLCSHLGKQNYK